MTELIRPQRQTPGHIASDVVSTLSFGTGVAENEAELQRYFLRTAIYKQLVRDDLDLVRGVKGSGKSAMFRFLQGDQIPGLADVMIIPAFDFSGDDLFLKIMREWSGANEDTLRRRWRVYVLALVGNTLLDRFGERELDELSTFLETLGLRTKEKKLAKVLAIFKTAPIAWDEETDEQRLDRIADEIGEVTGAIRAALARLHKRAWIVFDRLDEVFYTDMEAERHALRALIQVAKDLNALASGKAELRVKLFLREDIFRRITTDLPQTNLSHIRKDDIRWNPDLLADVLTRRLVNAPAFRNAFSIPAHAGKSREERQAIISSLIPEQTPGSLPCHKDQLVNKTWNWTMLYLRDGTNYVSPRNLMAFFDLAARFQEEIWDHDQTDEVVTSLLSGRALYRAWVRLSELRFDDTVMGEHQGLGPLVERLQSGSYKYARSELAERLGCEPQSPEFDSALQRLVDSTLLRAAGGGEYVIGLLYRPALRVKNNLR